MEPRLLKIWGDPPEPELLDMVARHLTAGGLVAMPTETVFGFGACMKEAPLRELQRLKRRGNEKPFLVLVPSMESVPELVWTDEARELARAFWPGALTLVLRDDVGRFPPGVRSLTGTVGIRQSPHTVARGVVEILGEPVLSTSANPPGEAPALTAKEALETAFSLGAGMNLWVLDRGELEASKPSTIIDCTGSEPIVLRCGSIPLDRIRCIVPTIEAPAKGGSS